MGSPRIILSALCAAFCVTLSLTGYLTGCSFIGKKLIEKPKVQLQRVDVRDVGATGATVVFGVQVENPNSTALKVDSLRYDVEIGGKPFSSGRLPQGAEVPANGKVSLDIPVPVRYTDVFASLVGLLADGTSTYRLKGEAVFGLFTIPFEKSGEFKLRSRE